jgi:selenocysteine lyase/cysteine desulfurase
MSGDAELAALRSEEFPLTADTIYLNSASTGPLPERTRRAIDAFNRRRAAPHLLPDADLFAVLDESRRLVAELLHAGTDEIALTTSTSFGLNLAALSLPLERGDVVLVSDREFPANVYPWRHLRDRGVVVELAPVTADGWPDEAYLLERIGDPRVRVLAVSLVQFSNGYAVDLARLSAATRASGTWLVVDAIQGVGHLPVDLRATPVDILSCGGQKWLLSPWGAAFTYVRRELLTTLAPPMVSWMAYEGTDDFSRLTEYADELRSDARRFEMITLPYQDFAGMNASLGMLVELGAGRIGAHARACHAPLLDWAQRSGVPVTSPSGERGSAIVCVAPPDPAAVHGALRAAGVICSLREGSLRFSPHLFNTVAEMERVVEILERG